MISIYRSVSCDYDWYPDGSLAFTLIKSGPNRLTIVQVWFLLDPGFVDEG